MHGATLPSARTPLRGKPWLTLVATALGVIMVALDGTVVAIANPYIAKDLGASLSDLQWVTNAYLLALAVLLIPAGKLGDRYGRRRAFLIGVAGFALTSLAVGLAGSIGLVIFFRVLQGVFGALIMPNTLALLRSAFPADKLNSAVGIWGAATAASTAGGPILAGVLVEHINWESVFYINIPVGVIALVVGLTVLAESRATERSRLDLVGLVVLGIGLFALIFGVIKAQTWGWADARTLGFIGGGLVVLILFLVVESRVTAPLLPLALFRDRSVSIGSITVLLNFFALFGVLFFVTLYLQNVHGYSAVGAGIRTLPLTVMFVVSSPLSGWLTGRFGPRVPIMIGLLASAASMFALLWLETDSAFIHLWPPMVGLGLGIGLVVVASTEAIVGNTPVEYAGVAGGVQSTFTQLGGVLGSAVLGSVLASRVGSVLVGHLTAAGLPASAANQMRGAKEFVSQGVAPVPKGTPAATAQAITTGSHTAFMSGLHVALVVAAVISLAGALIAPFIRRGQLPTTPEPEPQSPVQRAIHGTVREPGGAPIGDVVLTLIDPAGQQVAVQVTDPVGAYRLSVPNSGRYVLIAGASSYQPHAVDIELDGRPVEVHLTLHGSAALTGVVTGPTDDAVVSVVNASGDVVGSATVEATGSYTVDGLTAGEHTLIVSAPRLRPAAAMITLSAGGVLKHDIALRGGGSLRGTTRTSAGPIADAQVSLLDNTGTVVAVTRTDQSGGYSFDEVPDDDYTLVASTYPPSSAPISIGAGDVRRHDIELGYPPETAVSSASSGTATSSR